MELLKKYWKKGAVYGAVVVVLGGFLWQYDIGGKELNALSRLPQLEASIATADSLSAVTDANMLDEISDLNDKREEQNQLIAIMGTEIKNLTKATDEMHRDIKELLRR